MGFDQILTIFRVIENKNKIKQISIIVSAKKKQMSTSFSKHRNIDSIISGMERLGGSSGEKQTISSKLCQTQ